MNCMQLDSGSFLPIVGPCLSVFELIAQLEAEPARPEYILTEPGVGYRFRSNP